MTTQWPKPHGFDGGLRLIVPGHGADIRRRGMTMVERAPERKDGRSG
jgi:hypothetical protein